MSDVNTVPNHHLLVEATRLTIKASQLIVEAEDCRRAADGFHDQMEGRNKPVPESAYDQSRELRRQAHDLLSQARDLLGQARSAKSA